MSTSSSSQRLHSQPSTYGASGKAMEPPVNLEHTVDEVCIAVGRYASQHPVTVSGFIFLLGVYVGWKIKPW